VKCRILAAATAALALLPSTAAAATLTNSGGTLTYIGTGAASDVDLAESSPGTVQLARQPMTPMPSRPATAPPVATAPTPAPA
jgi:hypothetical protein